MEEKERLIQQLDQARATMQAVLDEVDTQIEVYPEWTIKQILAHIIGWDDVTTTALRAHAQGQEPSTPAARGIDHYNAHSVATRQALSYEHILKECDLAREELKAAIRDMPDEKLAQPMLFPWGQTGTVAQVVAIFVHHEEQHAQEIRDLIAKSA
jgi:hypothetical protein